MKNVFFIDVGKAIFVSAMATILMLHVLMEAYNTLQLFFTAPVFAGIYRKPSVVNYLAFVDSAVTVHTRPL